MSKVCFCIVSGIYPGRSGDDGYVDPPVPIPNTVVKHINAESTWLETAWEDRKLPVKKWQAGRVYLPAWVYGGRGEVVNTLDCGSSTRGFDPHRSPHIIGV